MKPRTIWYIEESVKRVNQPATWERYCTPEWEKETKEAFSRLKEEHPATNFRMIKTTWEVVEVANG